MTMDVNYIARNVSLPDSFREHAEAKFDKIEQLATRAQRLEIKATKEAGHRHAEDTIRVELTVVGKGKVVRSEAAADDKTAAFDLAFSKLLERLRRLRDRRKDHHRAQAGSEPAPGAVSTDTGALLLDQILAAQRDEGVTEDEDASEPEGAADVPVRIREKVFPARPMTPDEAVDAMELVGHDFYVFVDAETSRASAVYRRRGWSYGVISLDPELAGDAGAGEVPVEERAYRATAS